MHPGSTEATRYRSYRRLADSAELDFGLYERQMAGIAALIAIANDVATVSRTGGLRAVRTESLNRGVGNQGIVSLLARRLRHDHMLRNALYLVANSGLQAAFGFTFWIVTAHLFSAANVGRASAMISANTVIAYLSLLGLNNAFGRYLPTARDRASVINSGLVLVGACGAAISLLYTLMTPFIAPDLAFVAHNPALALGFAFMTAAAAVNILTDSVFVASRKAAYTAFVDGIVGGIGKLVLAVALAGSSAYGLFLASTVGTALATVSSLLLIYTVMRYRPSLKQPLRTLKPLIRFSGANYVGNVLNMLPTLVVPVIVLDRLGAASEAYYFVVFQVVGILYAGALAIEQTFLSEGSRANADMRQLKRRSLRILITFCVPAAICLVLVGHWLLLAFGTRYYQNGWHSFILLIIAAGPITANYWCLTILRLAGKLRAIVTVNATYAITICVFAWFAAPHGLTALAAAWPVGALAAAVIAAWSLPSEDQVGHHAPPRGPASPPRAVAGVRRDARLSSERRHRWE